MSFRMFKPSKLFRKEENEDNTVSGMLKLILMTLKFFFVNKPASIVTHIAHTSLLISTLTELIYFLMFPSSQLIWDYGFSFFALFYIYILIITNYIQENETSEMETFMKEHFWNSNCCGPEMSKNLSKRARLCRAVGIFQSVIATINGVLFLPHESDRLDLYFILWFLEKNYNTFYQYYRFVFFTSLSWGTTLVLIYPNLFAFYITHLDFQFKLLTKHMENIEMDFQTNSSSYHEEIKRRLHFCISHFQKLMEFRKRILELMSFPIFLILWIGLGVSMFLSYHLILMNQHNNIIALGFLWLTVGECTIYFAIISQTYADLAEDFIHTLNKCNWYEWNNSNKKTFLLFLMYAQTYKVIRAGGLMPVNFSTTVWMGQKTASALTFFRAIQIKNNAILN